MHKLEKKMLGSLLDEILKSHAVYGPKAKEHEFSFDRLKHPNEIRLDYSNSILPPVKVFFPNNEKLIEYRISDGGEVKSTLTKEKKVLFAAHPCDLHAIHLMDMVFNHEPRDEYYLSRRKDSVLIGLNCEKPCGDKILCYDKKSYRVDGDELCDILLWDYGESYLVKVCSKEGEAFVNEYSLFEPFDGDFEDFLETFERKQAKNFEEKLISDHEELSKAIEETYLSKLWSEVGDKCLSCGSCNIVCPTCFCFEIVDELDIDLEGGSRCRHWDSCQNNDFACVGSGENFRELSSQRNRHRVFKKEVYLKKKYGLSGCVGCGRCNSSCIAEISLIEIYNRALAKEII